MTGVDIEIGASPARDELAELYDAVGWPAYTQNLEVLVEAVANSTLVVSARSGGALVGMARVVSDCTVIAYLQDVLVDPAFHRRGVGRRLVEAAMEPFAACRQQVLLTDDEPGLRAFYESLGWTEIRDVDGAGLRAFVRFTG